MRAVRRTPRTGPVSPLPPADTTVPAPEVLAIRVAPVEPRLVLRKTVAVTKLLDLMGFSGEYKVSDQPAPTLEPAFRGTLVHHFLERWDGTTDPAPLIDATLRRRCPAPHLREPLAADLARVADRFGRSTLAERMAYKGPIRREAPFLLRVGGILVSGVVDAILPDGALVDYKTGSRGPGAQARYEAQLCVYAAAMRTLLHREPPHALLWYVDEDDLCEVDVSTARVASVMDRAQKAVERTYEPATG